jgi:DNA-binding beta-propeller fold protein YncE/predicted Ser/Thr protein kinase
MDNDLFPRTLGSYQIVAEIAHGGMATVYRALQPRLGRYVALKILSPEFSRDPDFVERFEREARIAARLEHPNIVPIYDVGEADGAFYIAMRLVPGESLAHILSTGGPLPVQRTRAILGQVASALDYAHRQGVVHRDVKPGNILVEDDDHVSLADFGIARATDATRVTRFGVLVGTPAFMAPEQVQGLDVDYRADLYSMGVVAYLMFTGRAPFEADSVVTLLHKHVYDPPPPACTIRPDLPQEIDAALSRMLAKQPGERYPTAAAFATALHAEPPAEVTVYRGAAPGPPRQIEDSATQTAAKPRKRSAAPWLMLAGLLAVVLAAVGALSLREPNVLLTVAPNPTSAAPTSTVPLELQGTWEILAGDPTAAGFFNGPAGVAINQQGEIFITEQLNHRIQKLSASGQPLAQWGTFGDAPGQFRDPSAIVLDREGNLYVADTSNNRVQKLGPDGRPLTQWGGSGQLSSPLGVALDADGNVYVADSGNNRIQKFSPTGQVLQQWGIYGTAPGQFSTPSGVALDAQNNLFVLDAGNNRIQKLAQDGRLLASWGKSRNYSTTPTPETDNSELTFGALSSIVLDASGNLLVVDSGTDRIVKISTTGAKLAEWGDWGSVPGEFESPVGIGLDSQGDIFVADHDNDRIQKLSADGKPLTQWGSERTPPQQFRQPSGIAVDSQGNSYVVDKNNERVQKLSATGEHVAQWGGAGDKPGQFSSPIGVALDGQGNILVADSGNERVQRFKPDGQLLAFWGKRGEGPGQLKHPAGIAVDQQGNIYLTDTDADQVLKFSATGQPLAQWGKTGDGAGEFKSPLGIAVAADGSIYVADQGNSRVQKLSSTGQPLKQWGDRGSEHGQFQRIVGIALDPQGNVLVADADNNRVYQFSPDGKLMAESGARGMLAGQFQGPAGLAVDGNGSIYVTEIWNHRVQRLRRVGAP